MRIKSVNIDGQSIGLKRIEMSSLGETVVITGENGAGKTRLIKLIEKELKQKDLNEEQIELEFDENKISSIVNFSHTDLPLQLPNNFPPYVISVSEKNLKSIDCDFKQTAYDALLYITKLIKYSPPERLDEFNDKYYFPLFNSKITIDESGEAWLFENVKLSELDEKPLSPGQSYLLRLCVALSCELIKEGTILFLDEPETHLHPKVLIKVFEVLRRNFRLGQLWIATHSIELVSYFYYSEIWYIENGSIVKMGSKTTNVLNGLIGEDIKRWHLQEFISSPDSFAINVFAVECLKRPGVHSKVREGDPSTVLAAKYLKDCDEILDFGAGKGRFLESLKMHANNLAINYFAYDKYGDKDEEKSGEECKKVMSKYGIDTSQYYGNTNDFMSASDKLKVDKVVLINVLHEISPKEWEITFKDIGKIIKDDGVLLIVERLELTYGEQPYESDFFVLQPEAIPILFNSDDLKDSCKKSDKNEKVVAYYIPANYLKNVTHETIRQTINKIEEVASKRIKEIKCLIDKKENEDFLDKKRWELGVELAFWTHQHANASLFDF